MAKKQGNKVAGPVAVGFSAGLAKAIDTLRKPFMDYAVAFKAIAVRRADLAPKFMEAFDKWAEETGRSQFVEFCRVVDPAIPTQRDDYRAHSSYQAADYLRRLVARTDRGAGVATPIRTAGYRLARMIATLLPLIKPTDQTALWDAIGAESELRPAQIGTLRRMVKVTQPFLELHAKPQALKVIHAPKPAALPRAA